MDVGARHVRRLWARYRNTGSPPTIGRGGRPATKTVSDEEVELVPAECGSGGSGAGRITWASAGKNIRGRTIYEVMKEHGLVEPCPARTKKTQAGEP